MSISKKVVLFDGNCLDEWHMMDASPASWEIDNGSMTSKDGNIITNEVFTDARIHAEFSTPDMPGATGQAKGNSGVFIQGRYEIQVLDSFGIHIPGKGDCGAIYNMYAPLVNACKPPTQWQTYDIFFRAARINNETEEIMEYARMTVLHNGEIIHNNVEIKEPTGGELDRNISLPGPLMLQYHGNEVCYRNIWLCHLPLSGSDTYEPR